MNYLISLFVWFSCSAIALAQDAADPTPMAALPVWLSQWAPILIGVMLACRGVAEGLLKIADALSNDKTTTLHKVANGVATVAQYLGTIVAMFGFGMPKSVILDKADQLASKGASNGPKDGSATP